MSVPPSLHLPARQVTGGAQKDARPERDTAEMELLKNITKKRKKK
jgi:hypothetical protein